MRQLCSLLIPGESVWLAGESYPRVPELILEETLECFQMVMPQEVSPPEPATDIVRLSNFDAPEMVALTTLAFPGFFRERTCEMGSYYGIRSSSGELIAMAGERLMLDNFVEISGVCTHPSYRGKGTAAKLVWHLVRDHRREGLISWLHVGGPNHRAVELYGRIGFEVVRKITLNRICREK